MTVQTQRSIVARQLHRISLVPRPQSVDTQPCTRSSFGAMLGAFGRFLGIGPFEDSRILKRIKDRYEASV